MKIAFFGTPAFAIPTLQKLIESEYDLVVVYTKPPKPCGRGLKEMKSQVHILSELNNVEVRCPKNLKHAEDIKYLQSLNLDIAVTVAYGIIIPQNILDIPKHGFINIHPSDLPRWRGAAPIQRSIMAGDTKTAICIMKMDAGLDTGDVIIKKEIPLNDEITAGQLHDTSAEIGAKMTLEVLNNLEKKGCITAIKQLETGLLYADKITNKERVINWRQDAKLVNCQIRALSPYPSAYFKFKGEIIKVISASFDSDFKHKNIPGTVIDDDLSIACANGIIRPELLQREGRKMIYRKAFLRGFSVPKNTLL